ncbi:Serine/threonine-protein kinase ppk6 [Choanephora cucurbitarum]|uniref:Serine/threonine-protein kinase ppk6 n=1 Tax=Choanephora cucurbitarum TaxID=101091 RepID=A0A1C7NAL1_9FUNG|nr:Serine/threonine-protein kinase ppk6 [Choanephora cucurbitarum]
MSFHIPNQNQDDNQPCTSGDPLEKCLINFRASNDSSPKSGFSDSEENNTNEVALQSFERFRESSVTSIEDNIMSITANPPPNDSIAEYCAESLYSYSFTPLSRVHKAAKIKRQILSRGMDYMQRIRWKTGERDTGRRFSQPDIGVLDQNNDWVTEAPEGIQHLKICPSLNDIASRNPELAPSVSNLFPQPLANNNNKDTNMDMKPPELTLSSPIPNSALRHSIAIDHSEKNDNDLDRRKTIEAFHNLPPIYEMPQPTSELPYSTQYTRALHAPSRFLPQNQAILTTDADATILLFNDIASLCFGFDKSYIGKSILYALEDPFRSQIRNILKRRRTSDQRMQSEKGLVLVCGIVVPIRKINGETLSAASLWLKEKTTEEGKNIYIWIFEEIYETSLSVQLDDKGNVVEVADTIKELFGYEIDQIVGNSITQIIPALTDRNRAIPSVDLNQIEKLKFYGGKSKSGVCFPTMVSIYHSPNKLKIVSLPSIAGLITVHSNGKIQSINPVPAKYLFGYSTETLVENFSIDQIIPQFSKIVSGLRRCELLQFSSTVNNHACRWAISEIFNTEKYQSMDLEQSLKHLERQPSISVNGQALPIIYAVHRDGSQFEIQLQLRLIKSEEEDLVSVWVTYDRIYALKRSKKAALAVAAATAIAKKRLSQEKHLAPPPPPPNDRSRHPLSPEPTKAQIEQDQEPKSSLNTDVKKRPPIRTYGVSSFGSVDKSKALFPGGLSDHSEEEVPRVSHELLKQEKKEHHPMDDYVIIGTLGEGAYGTAKLAYRKDDPLQAKVVIKFIAKSRIIVDSWIRDRKLGLIPLEIHILKKLKEHPQANCCSLETYMEDEDTYFVVMKMFGTSSMDLFDYIELNEKIPETEVKNIFRQVALAVEHIQSLRVVHRDIKDENILLDETGCVHLIDFGSAAYFRKGRTFDTFGGTLDYCAPEILKGMPYEGPPQDIWSLDEILEQDLRIPFVMSEGSLDLIKKMLNRDVEKRYNIHEVLEHPWLRTN